MYNLGDDSELDRMSRAAAGRYKTPARPDWDAMHEELDRVMPQEKKRRFVFFWWLLPGLLVAGLATYWLIGKENKTAPTATVVKTETVPQSNAKENAQSTQSSISKDQPKENVTTDNNTNAVDKQSAKANIRSSSDKNLLQLITSKSNPASRLANQSQEKLILPSSPVADIIPGVNNATQTAVPVIQQPGANSTANLKNEKTEVVKEQTETPNNINTTQSVSQETTSATKENKIEPVTTESPSEEIKPAADKTSDIRKPKRWSYAFLAGVDKSTVKFKYSNSPGINIGMMLGYHFNDKLSLHTGAIYTQKNYKLAGEDFTAPKGSLGSYYKLENVTGYCRMWEVPLLLRYTMSRSAKHSFSLSTGLSSYFMTRENYDYFYYYNGQPVTRNNTYNSKDTHVLSIFHLSAGFENRLSKDWSVQIEPYAKLPLGGVGLGNIQLSSFGVNFSFQHRQR
jgi:hypothetical protein